MTEIPTIFVDLLPVLIPVIKRQQVNHIATSRQLPRQMPKDQPIAEMQRIGWTA